MTPAVCGTVSHIHASLGRKSMPVNALGVWKDGVENSVLNTVCGFSAIAARPSGMFATAADAKDGAAVVFLDARDTHG